MYTMVDVVNTEIVQSHMEGIFIRDRAYFIAIQ